MHLRIAMCKNSTENNNSCYPEEVIRQKMANFFVNYMYRDSYVDGKNYNSPVNYYITSNTIKSSSYSYRREIIIYKHLGYHIDAGILLSGDDLIQEYQVNWISPDSTPDINTKIFANILLGLSDIKDVYERRYIKFQI